MNARKESQALTLLQWVPACCASEVASPVLFCSVLAMAFTGCLAATVPHCAPSPPLPLPHFSSQLCCSLAGVPGVRTQQRERRRRVCSYRRGVMTTVAAMGDANTTSTGSRVEEKLGVRIERGPSEARLQELGIRSWPKWGCPASKFPWIYDGKETCYLLQGKVKVYPEESSDFVEFGAGDLVVFPKGMSCTWHVSEAVDKHYQFKY